MRGEGRGGVGEGHRSRAKLTRSAARTSKTWECASVGAHTRFYSAQLLDGRGSEREGRSLTDCV
eukprot:4963647-Pleurochrysis_carterae.AAC.1